MQVCEAEAAERGGEVYDCGFVLGVEAFEEVVASLGGGVVYAVDQVWDGGWCCC